MKSTSKLVRFLEDDFYDDLREPTKRDRRIKDSDFFEAKEGVFDTKTIEAIEALKRRKIILDIYWVVSTGKEADVFYAKSPSGEELAVKIYRVHTSKFRRVEIYTIGDRRFNKARSKLKSKWKWASREFKNLTIAWKKGIHVPKPIALYRNIVVMEFIGTDGTPAPQLKDVDNIENPTTVFYSLLNDVKKLYREARLVHSDLSPFNILYHNNLCYIIDMAQGVNINHEYALRFLYRDLYYITNYFMAFLDDLPSVDEIFQEITGISPDPIIKSLVTNH